MNRLNYKILFGLSLVYLTSFSISLLTVLFITLMGLGWGGNEIDIAQIILSWFSLILIEFVLIISTINLFRSKLLGVIIGIAVCLSLLIFTLIDFIESNFWTTRQFKYFYSFEFLMGSIFPFFYLVILLLFLKINKIKLESKDILRMLLVILILIICLYLNFYTIPVLSA